MSKLPFFAAAVSGLALLTMGCDSGTSASRDQIRVVGSSTVLPFAKLAAEQFTKDNSAFKSPIIEGNGTGGGMKLFCAGVGGQHPDIENASRRIKKSEYEDCAKNGVKDIVEVQIGLDGIVLANAKESAAMALTAVDIYKAIAANPFGKANTAKTWKDVNPALPATPIQVYGPATISGTRDALKDLILNKACDTDASIKALKESNKDQHDKICGELRTDGAYADTSDNYNLIVQKLENNAQAVGIFGYSYLEANADKLKGLTIGGVSPSYTTIADGTYPGWRPLYIYIKKAHIGAIPGLKEYATTWPKLWGKDGVLTKAGMIVLPADKLSASEAALTNMTVLDPSTLK